MAPPATALRRVLLWSIGALGAWAFLLALTGGLDLRPHGISFRSTNPSRPAYAMTVLLIVYALAFRAEARRHAAAVEARVATLVPWLERRATGMALALAAATFVGGIVYGMPVAGGSDSYGYVSQARLWLARDLVIEQPIADDVPWPDADWTFAPLGYRPAMQGGAIVPVYAPGLPVLMALATTVAGACGPFLVVPLLGATLVWLTHALGTRLWSPLAGLASAALMASSPTFLFMLMNPMSDVPVTAFFAAAVVAARSRRRGSAFCSGLLASVAVFIRPNLVPVAGVVLVAALLWHRERPWRTILWFGAGGLPLVLAVAALHTHLYGAPWKAGYGTLEELYAWSNGAANLAQYSAWLLRTETPFLLLAFVPVAFVRRLPPPQRSSVLLLIAFTAAVWLCYLFYTPFDVWWYLRFLLPAFPPLLLLAVVGCAMCLARLRRMGQPALALALALAVTLVAVRATNLRREGIFGLWQGGIVYVSAAEYVRTALPANAIVLTVQHSGSLRYYTGRLTLRWDLLAREWWSGALDALVERGYRPYILVSSFEEAQLRRQFGFSDAPDAPGTVVAAMDRPESIRIYDPLRETAGAPDSIDAVVPCRCGGMPR